MSLRLLIVVPLVFIIALGGCADSDAGDRRSVADSIAVARAADSARIAREERPHTFSGRLFDDSSGVVELVMSFQGLGEAANMVLYFEDYGLRQALYTTSLLTTSEEQVQIHTGDGWVVTYNPKSNTGHRALTFGHAEGPRSMLGELTPARRRRLNVREVQSMDVLGRTAEGFAFDSAGVTTRIWHWRGLLLRMEITSPQTTATVEAVRVETNVPVPQDRFEIPPEVRFNIDTLLPE